MGLYQKPGSAFWWMLLEGHNRRRENTWIRCDGSTAELRKLQQQAAETIYHARMVQLARARVGLPAESRQTFGAFADWYQQHHLEKQRSAPRGRVILNSLREHFSDLALGDIRPARWAEYETARRAAGVSVNTIGRELAVMKALLHAAVGDHLEVSPLAHVKRKSIALPPKRTLTADEEKALLPELRDEELHDLYLVGVGTLLRQMNLIMLRRREHQKTRLVVQTKTGPHQVPLTGPTDLQTRAATVLQARMPSKADGYFFPKWQQRFANNRDGANAMFLRTVRRAAARADLPWGLAQHGLVWHTMTRASGATRMLSDYGQSIRTVQVIGNWRSLDQMAAYLGVEPG